MANKEISRRDFIKGMAAGAVGMATMGVLGSYPKAAAEEAAKEALYTPGTYSATAKGIAGDVKVTMTFSESAITDVKIDVSAEPKDIGAKIGPEMEKRVLDAQSYDVDAVSGATVTSDAVKKAVANCISQATGKEITLTASAPSFNADWLGEPPAVAESDITETVDTEILVVGCGTGGWIAAMTAAEEGAKVYVVEKAAEPTKIKEDIGAIDSKLQQASFAEFPEFKIDKTEALLEIVRYASGYADSNLVKVWIDNSAELVDWLTEKLESTGHWFMQFEGGVGNLDYPDHTKAFATGHSPHPVEGKPAEVTLNTDMQEFVESRGGTIRCNTSLV